MYLEEFIEHFPIYVELMKSTQHDSPYHLEGSVWTHTCMVYAITRSNRPDCYVPQIAAILHDLGKCFTKTTTPEGKASFRGHEGVSVHLALDILGIYDLTTAEKIQILNLISLHGVNISQLSVPYMALFRHADATGRLTTKSEIKDYEPRKFLKPYHSTKRTVTILTGLPCTGKSTYASKFKDTHNIISRDDFLMSPEWNNENLPYNEIYKETNKNEGNLAVFNGLFEKYISTIAKDYSKDIIIDMTMMSLSSRRSMMAKFPNSVFKSVVMLTKLSTVHARNVNRTGKVTPDKVLHMMQTAFTIPVREEGFSDVQYILG